MVKTHQTSTCVQIQIFYVKCTHIELDDQNTHIVCMASDSGYAIQLFDIRPMNFLLKPVKRDKFIAAVETAMKLSAHARMRDAGFIHKISEMGKSQKGRMSEFHYMDIFRIEICRLL